MSEKFRNRFRIKSARAPWWDYGRDAAYFITICTKGRKHFFGHISNHRMQLSPMGVIADLMWYEIKNHSKNCSLGEFVVMPDHVHGLLILQGNELWIDKSDGSDGTPMVETRHALSLPLAFHPNEPLAFHLNEPLPIHPVEPLLNQWDESLPNQSTEQWPIPPFNLNPIGLNMERISPAQSRFQNQGKNTISSIIGSYKSAVTKHAHRLGFEFAWQPRFHDHIIRTEEELERVSDYIRRNVENWNE